MVSDSAEEFEQEAADLVAAIEAKKPKKRDYSYTQNRELSWLQFNRRVLEEAIDPTVPLLERIKFISIFCTNLDEFFMVRVGSITDLSIIAPEERENKSNMAPEEQLDAIFASVKPLVKERDEIYAKVTKELKKYGFKELDMNAASKKQRKFARDYYRDFVRPVLSPQVVDERHPFPHLKNKELYVVTVLSEEDGSQHLGIVPVPENISPIITDPDNPLRFVRAEKLIAYNIGKIFDIYETSEPAIIAVTRNADISFDEEKFSDDEGDYRLHVSRLLKKRNRLNPVRLEVEGKADKTLINPLLKRLKLTKNQAYYLNAPINLGWVFGLEKRVDAKVKSELCYPPFIPRASEEFDLSQSIFEQVKERDRILFYPYDSMDPFLRMLQEAAYDPTVLSIKITVYRLADDSRVAQHLVEAAENGKEVTVLMELRARFDEANNIDWAGRLEEAGCNIIYGMENYKCHSKVCLITRQDNGRVTNITQIGTGNYNEKTARLYTDLSLITADEVIGRDAVTFFQNLQIGNLNGDYEKLLVAPSGMKKPLLKLIDREIAKGEKGRITLKANSVTERDVIDRLSEASRAGVQVRMNIRGICCQLPGIEGKTENIHVRSIVGQFLEHSRIYIFGEGEDLKMFIGSADLMTRNLVHRVEVACPVTDPAIRSSILLFMEKIFEDNCKARSLGPDGEYSYVDKAQDADLFAHEGRFCLHDWCIEHPLQGAAPVEDVVQEELPLEAETDYVMEMTSVSEADLEAVSESDIDEVIQSLSPREDEAEDTSEPEEPVDGVAEPEEEPAADEGADVELEEAADAEEEAAPGDEQAPEAEDEVEEEPEAEQEPEAETEADTIAEDSMESGFDQTLVLSFNDDRAEDKAEEASAVKDEAPVEADVEPEVAEASEPEAKEQSGAEPKSEEELAAKAATPFVFLSETKGLAEEAAASEPVSEPEPELETEPESEVEASTGDSMESGFDQTLVLSFNDDKTEDKVEEAPSAEDEAPADTDEESQAADTHELGAEKEPETADASESEVEQEPEEEPAAQAATPFVFLSETKDSTEEAAAPEPEPEPEPELEPEADTTAVKDVEFELTFKDSEPKTPVEEKEIELGIEDDEDKEDKVDIVPELDSELAEKLNGLLSNDAAEAAESKADAEPEPEPEAKPAADPLIEYETKKYDPVVFNVGENKMARDREFASGAPHIPPKPAEETANKQDEPATKPEEKPAEEPKKKKRKGFFARWFS